MYLLPVLFLDNCSEAIEVDKLPPVVFDLIGCICNLLQNSGAGMLE